MTDPILTAEEQLLAMAPRQLNKYMSEGRRGYEKKPKQAECLRRWLTVGAKSDVEFAEFFKVCNRNFRRKWITKAQWVFEQRSRDPEVYSGWHCHCLFEMYFDRSHPYSACIKELKDSFDDVCDVTNSRIFCNLPCIDADVDKRKAYLEGDKAENDDKLAMMLVDECWRQSIGIDRIYSHPVS